MAIAFLRPATAALALSFLAAPASGQPVSGSVAQRPRPHAVGGYARAVRPTPKVVEGIVRNGKVVLCGSTFDPGATTALTQQVRGCANGTRVQPNSLLPGDKIITFQSNDTVSLPIYGINVPPRPKSLGDLARDIAAGPPH
jgi:hypothetical protein